MATAIVRHKEPVQPPIESVTLVLSEYEARVLKTLTGGASTASGHPIERALSDIYDALKIDALGFFSTVFRTRPDSYYAAQS